MRSKNSKTNYRTNKGKIKLLPKSPALAVLLMAVILVEVTFMSMLTILNILPTLYNVIILIVLIALTVLVFKLLACRKEVTKQRKIGTIISALMIIILAIGCFYLFTTYAAFNKMSDEDKQYEDFHVVALKSGNYKKLEDINGETVFTGVSPSSAYEKAQEKLKKEADVKYKEAGGYLQLKSVLIDDKNKEHDKLIFLSSNNYEMICEDVEGFEKKTRIVYTVSVEIDGSDTAKRVGITKEPFNVYISGIDTFGGINKVSRSDVNMIMTVDPVEKKILLTSIPRDMYVDLHSYGAKDKLTHSGIYGVGETVETVEDWLDIDINYYIRVNFTSLKDIVDAIGGVDVESPYAFESSVSRYSYDEGINHLDGEAALFFARERKSFEAGDQERIKNQQRVLKGILDKITGSTAILTGYTQILNTVGDEIQTNLSESDISALVKMQLEDIGGWTIKTTAIKGAGTYASTYSMGSRQLYVVIPDEFSVKDAQTKINEMTGK